MSAPVESPEKTDGRRARAVASRARILKAMVDLIEDGEIQPSAEAVALRAGVGVRTVFRLFNDVDGLRQGLQEVMDERLAPIYAEPVHGTLLERLDQLVARRRIVFEKLARPKAFADAHRAQSPSLTAAHQTFVRRQRELLLGHLQGVLPASAGFVEALDLTLSFDVWRRLREDQHLSADDAQNVVLRMVHAVVAEFGG
jgi:AcrR family transcriptional regulator